MRHLCPAVELQLNQTEGREIQQRAVTTQKTRRQLLPLGMKPFQSLTLRNLRLVTFPRQLLKEKTSMSLSSQVSKIRDCVEDIGEIQKILAVEDGVNPLKHCK